VSQFDNDLIT